MLFRCTLLMLPSSQAGHDVCTLFSELLPLFSKAMSRQATINATWRATGKWQALCLVDPDSKRAELY